MMMMELFSFTIMLLLPLTASRAGTTGQNPNVTDVTDVMTHNQPTAQDSSSSHPPTGISGPDTIHENLTQPSPSPSLQTTPTTPLKTLPPNATTAATKSQSLPLSMSTLGQETATPATTVQTSQAGNQTLTTAGTPTLSSSTQRQDSTKTSTPQISKTTHYPSTHPTQTTDLISTSVTLTESKSPSPVPDGGATASTGPSRTSKATTKAPPINTTKENKGQDPSTKQSGDSKAVAGIIGGTLALMMLGFLIIYLKKRKLRKQQITTSDWAGPSPFLEGGADISQAELRSNNRISLSSFLPQRLSKRLSLLPETEEEMEDLTPGSTFGDKTNSTLFGREVAGNGLKESNGTAGVNAEMTSNKDSAETFKKTQNSEPLATNNNSEDATPSQDLSAGPTPPAADVEKAPEHLSNGSEQP